jgi:Putative zinc-finger
VNQSGESHEHERAAQLIPWLVNGTLPIEEATPLRAHLADCAKCRSDFESEQHLYESIRSDGPLVFTGESSFEKLMARIESERELATEETATAGRPMSPVGVGPPEALASEARVPLRHLRRRGSNPAARRPRRASPGVRWLTAAVLVEAVALTLGGFLWYRAERAPGGGYVTLSEPPVHYGEGTRVRAVFATDLTLDGLQRLLRATGAHIVDGPSDARVYTLGFAEPRPSAAQVAARLATLRADPHVLFAEVATEASPR